MTPADPAKRKSRVLVVEDEAIIACDLQRQLGELGYEPVGPAMRGEEAIDLAGSLRPDLVLMDIRLAGAMNGMDAAADIRAQWGLPIVLLTALPPGPPATPTEPAGHMLIKPFTKEGLRTVLELALVKPPALMPKEPK
jgi:CheY-like chemotaxis protein